MRAILAIAGLIGVALAAEEAYVLKHSLLAPIVAVNNNIPFWALGAGAYVNDTGKFVRITPAKQSRTGFLWNTHASSLAEWEATFEFSVSGQPRLGGDGFAFWFIERDQALGTVYGSSDYWNGLGIFFDTFNNDGRGSSPYISAQFNDGTQKYDASTDGESQALGSCSYDFRNLEAPSAARLRYQNKQLVLEIALQPDRDSKGALIPGQYTFSPCFTIANMELGIDKFFGFTAHTGDVADNHDIYSMKVKDLTPANTNLDAVRELYHQRVLQQQKLPEHHAEVSTAEFQGEVISRLNQIQSAQNLIETSQIAIGDLVARALQTMPTSAPTPTPATSTTDQSSSANPQMMNLLNSINARLERQAAAPTAPQSNDRTSPVDPQLRADLNRLRDDVRALVTRLERQSLTPTPSPNTATVATASGVSWPTTVLIWLCTAMLSVLVFWAARDRADRPPKKLL